MERDIAVPVSEGLPSCSETIAIDSKSMHDLRDVPPPPFDWSTTERGRIREDGRSGHWAVVTGRGPTSPSRSLQATDVDHDSSPQTSLFQDFQNEVASEVADAGDPVKEVGPTLHDSSHESDTETVLSRARGRKCVNRFFARFRIHCSTAGLGRPSVSADTSWFCCSGFDQRAGHFHTPGM